MKSPKGMNPKNAAPIRDTDYLRSRFNRISGHLRRVRKMVEDGEDCSKVLIQLSAVSGALNGMGKIVLTRYLDECMKETRETGDTAKIERFKELMHRFAK